MAPPTPPPPVTADRPGAPLVYRPLSGLAIIGMACGVLFASIALFSVAVLFFKRDPIFLPDWLLVLPVAGAILCVLALRQIRNSEDTRAGATLARWGLWLSVLAGLGSATFSAFTGLAIKQQANHFLLVKGDGTGFFPRLLDGDVNGAFLLTQTFVRRRRANPQDERGMEFEFDTPLDDRSPKGELSQFREADLVRALQQSSGPPAQVEPLGVRQWTYDDKLKAYTVERLYRVSTADMVFDFLVKVQSIDGDVPGEGRKWRVVWRGGEVPNRKLTDLGEKKGKLRLSAARFAGGWLVNMYGRQFFFGYLATVPPAERARRLSLFAAEPVLRVAMAAGGAPAGGGYLDLTPAVAALAFPQSPGAKDLAGGKGVLLVDQLRGVDRSLTNRARVAAAEMFARSRLILMTPDDAREQLQVKPEDILFSHWEEKDGKVEITFQQQFRVFLPQQKVAPPGALLTARLLVVGDANAGADRAAAADRNWQVVRLEFDRAYAVRMVPAAVPRPDDAP